MRLAMLRSSSDCTEETAELLLAGLPPEMRGRFARIQLWQKRLQSLAAYHLLKEMLRQQGISLPAIETDPQGKPFFPERPELHFNLSHSGDMAACALGVHPMGVDIQQYGGLRPAVARRCFSASELTWYESQTDPAEKERIFYQLWALKESFSKLTGQGIRMPYCQLNFIPDGGTEAKKRDSRATELPKDVFAGEAFSEEKKNPWQDFTLHRDSAKTEERIVNPEAFHIRGYVLDLPYALAACAEEALPECPERYRLSREGVILSEHG